MSTKGLCRVRIGPEARSAEGNPVCAPILVAAVAHRVVHGGGKHARNRVRVAVEPTNEEWIAASRAAREVHTGVHGTTRSRSQATPERSDA